MSKIVESSGNGANTIHLELGPGHLVGLIHDEYAELRMVHVEPEHRGEGIARELVSEFVIRATTRGAELLKVRKIISAGGLALANSIEGITYTRRPYLETDLSEPIGISFEEAFEAVSKPIEMGPGGLPKWIIDAWADIGGRGGNRTLMP